MGKIEKLNRQILDLELKIQNLEYDLADLRDQLKEREISKAEFHHLQYELKERKRAIRVSIKRKTQARLHFEKLAKEKEEEREKKRREKQLKKEKRLAEKEKERERREKQRKRKEKKGKKKDEGASKKVEPKKENDNKKVGDGGKEKGGEKVKKKDAGSGKRKGSGTASKKGSEMARDKGTGKKKVAKKKPIKKEA